MYQSRLFPQHLTDWNDPIQPCQTAVAVAHRLDGNVQLTLAQESADLATPQIQLRHPGTFHLQSLCIHVLTIPPCPRCNAPISQLSSLSLRCTLCRHQRSSGGRRIATLRDMSSSSRGHSPAVPPQGDDDDEEQDPQTFFAGGGERRYI